MLASWEFVTENVPCTLFRTLAKLSAYSPGLVCTSPNGNPRPEGFRSFSIVKEWKDNAVQEARRQAI